jgi:hypothetical protein
MDRQKITYGSCSSIGLQFLDVVLYGVVDETIFQPNDRAPIVATELYGLVEQQPEPIGDLRILGIEYVATGSVKQVAICPGAFHQSPRDFGGLKHDTIDASILKQTRARRSSDAGANDRH